jgi:hypothetical protein
MIWQYFEIFVYADLADRAMTANMMTGGVLFITISVMKDGFWNSV